MQALGFAVLCVADRLRGHTGILPQQLKRLIEAAAMVLCIGITLDPAAMLGSLLHLVVEIVHALVDWRLPHWRPDLGLAAVVNVWAGICIGSYGNAIGPALQGLPPARARTIDNPGPEWWQWGPLLRSAWGSLVVVGLIWGGPVMFLWPADHRVAAIPVAFVLAFLFSTWIARHIWAHYPVRPGDWAWGVQQLAFGPIAAISAWLLSGSLA